MNVFSFDRSQTLSPAESEFRSAIDDLAVYEPPVDATRDVVRVATRSLDEGRYLRLEVLNPMGVLYEQDSPDDLLYAGSIIQGGEEVLSIWIDGGELYTASYGLENRVPYGMSRLVITNFLDQTGSLL